MTQEELKILRKNGWSIKKERLMACDRIIISKNETTITIDKDHSKKNSYRVALSSIDVNYTKDGFSYALECLNVKREKIMGAIRFVLEETKNIENVRKEKYQND
jgi:hypothetical protein